MRKLITTICLITFIALQYGKIISYWHCRLTAPIDCDCQKTLLTGHTEKDHATTPLTIAKEKAEEVYLTHEITIHLPSADMTNNRKESLYIALIPIGYTASIFQPPRDITSI